MPVKGDVIPRRWCYLCNALRPETDFPFNALCTDTRFPFCYRHISHGAVMQRYFAAAKALSLAGVPHSLPLGVKP